jgi:hypothetical protein
MSRWYVGIEGVGMYKNVGVVANSQWQIVATKLLTDEPISLHTTPRNLLRDRLHTLLTGLEENSGVRFGGEEQVTVCVGMSGVTFDYERLVDLPKLFKEIGKPIGQLVCTGDAEIAFASHAMTDTGGCLICNSGSTAYVVRGGKGFRYGGWGPAIDDEGSGFWMGRAALRAVGEEYDQGLPESILWRELRDWLHAPDQRISALREGACIWERLVRDSRKGPGPLDERTLIFHFSHQVWHESAREGFELWRRIVAGFQKPLIRAWLSEGKNGPAGRIVAQAANDLVRIYNKALEVAGVEQGGFARQPLVFYGGVLRHNPEFRDLLYARIVESQGDRDPPILSDHPRAMRPACGALLFAIGGSESGRLRLPPPAVVEKILEQQRKPEFRADLFND